jgi:L-arabinokinase
LPAARLLFYVSGHGFGHATRTRALIAALRDRARDACDVHVRTEAPHWIFTERDERVTCSSAPIDVGVLQRSGMDLDLRRSLEAHEAFGAVWRDAVEREARFITGFGPSLVVGDIPPLAFAAAHSAGVPAVAVANFSWDWILEQYAADEPRWAPIVSRYREAYGRAAQLFRLPLHGDLSAFGHIIDTPFVVNRSTLSVARCRELLGVSGGDERRLVLVTFGGFGGEPIRVSADEDLSDYLFVIIGGEPMHLGGEWIALPQPSPVAHEDVMHGCDAVLGKTGYGTVAESLTHDTRFLYLPRRGFREVPVLEAGVERLGCARAMSRDDFEAGRWRRHLDALFQLPKTSRPVASNGAEVIAGALLDRIAVRTAVNDEKAE